jgi:dethiobiotin synthetase
MSGLFIAGTDTGVGKTLVTAGIAAYLRERGRDAGVMKPVESGGLSGAPASDSVFLKKISQSPDDLDLINTYAFEAPLAPGIAARLEGAEISFDRILESFRRLELLHSTVLVEGAGGLRVPLGPQLEVADLIDALEIPVLLVARMALGTLNHTLLSLDYLARRDIPVVGVVFNRTEAKAEMAERYNVEALAERTEVPIWGVLGHLEKPRDRREILAKVRVGIGAALERHFEVEAE